MKITHYLAVALWDGWATADIECDIAGWPTDRKHSICKIRTKKDCAVAAALLREMASALDGGGEDGSNGG